MEDVPFIVISYMIDSVEYVHSLNVLYVPSLMLFLFKSSFVYLYSKLQRYCTLK